MSAVPGEEAATGPRGQSEAGTRGRRPRPRGLWSPDAQRAPAGTPRGLLGDGGQRRGRPPSASPDVVNPHDGRLSRTSARSPHCVCGGAPWPRAAGPPAPALAARPAGATGQGLGPAGGGGGVLPGAGPPWLPALSVISLSVNLCLQHPKWTHQNEKGNRKQRQPLRWLRKVTPAAPFPPGGSCPPTLPSQLCAYTAGREGTMA